jgi:cytochrome c-type biogenesis protein CcmH
MPRMGRAVLLALALGAFLSAGPVRAGAAPSSPGLDYVTGKIICDCGCSNLTVKDCTCGKADQVRAEITRRLERGETPERILESYVEEYGEQILVAPTRTGFNLVGWLFPFAAILLAGVALVLLLRRWARPSPAGAAPAEAFAGNPPPPPDPSFLRRVQEEMDGGER